MKNQQTHILEVQNLKCGGCAKTIQKNLGEIENVTDVSVNDIEGTVAFTAEENILPNVTQVLAELGYPIVGENNSLVKKATSYVSCMKGRVS